MDEDREFVIALKAGASDEASEQTRQGDFDFTGLSERLLEDERRSCTGRRQQRVRDGSRAVSCALGLQYFPNAGILDV